MIRKTSDFNRNDKFCFMKKHRLHWHAYVLLRKANVINDKCTRRSLKVDIQKSANPNLLPAPSYFMSGCFFMEFDEICQFLNYLDFLEVDVADFRSTLTFWS